MKSNVIALAMVCLVSPGFAGEAGKGTKDGPLPYRIYAMDTGLRGPDVPTTKDRVLLLKKLGYSGVGWTWNPRELPVLLKLLDMNELELSAIYLSPSLGDKVDPELVKAIPSLKGRKTLLEMAIRGSAKRGSPEGDAQAVALLQELSDLVGDSGPVISVYPHIGFYTATEEDGFRLAKKIGRKNVATHFNLYHSPDRAKLEVLELFFKKALPHIACVTINGLDKGKIVPLDQGKDVDLSAFLNMLGRVGYRGPVGLQAWSVPGPSGEHLARSMKRWQELIAK